MRRFHPTHNKSSENSSFLRYLKARFQPFKKPLFWGSLGGGLLLAICIWQYSQHPEWLDTTVEQPDSLDLSEESATTPLDSPREVAPSAQNELESSSELEAAGTALPSLPSSSRSESQLSKPQQKEAQATGEESAKIFPALVPDQSSSAADNPVSNQDLIERASFDNVRSFFEGNNSSKASPSNLNSDQNETPDNPSSLPSVEPVPVAPSPLEQAVERVMSESEPSQAPAAAPEANANPTPPVSEAEAPPARPNFSESSIGTAGYEQYGTTPVVPNYNPTPTASPATPSYGTPQQSPYGQSTTPNSVANPPGVSAEPGLPTTPEEQLDSYNFNNSFTPPSIPRSQPNQTNYAPAPQNGTEERTNSVGVESPQYQQPIQIEQPEFSDSPF